MRHQAYTALLAVAIASQIGASECGGPPIIEDPGFDLWCGDELCSWKVVRGQIERVGTWHDGDSGVELVGPDSAIQQLSSVTSERGNCIEFSLIANVESTAEVNIDIDIEGDGTVEKPERIPTSSWKPIAFHIYIEPPYDGIRFEINKRGTGRAQLAQIEAEISDGCEGLPQLDATPRPNGASCMTNDDCGSGLCIESPLNAPPASVFGRVCAGCDPTAAEPCATGEACRIGEPIAPFLAAPLTCVPITARQLALPHACGDPGTGGSCD